MPVSALLSFSPSQPHQGVERDSVERLPDLQDEKEEGIQKLDGDGGVVLPNGRPENQSNHPKPTSDQSPASKQSQAEERAEDGFYRRHAQGEGPHQESGRKAS